MEIKEQLDRIEKETKTAAEKAAEAKAAEIVKTASDTFNQKLKEVEEKHAEEIKLIRDEADKKSKEMDESLTEINRIRITADENAKKGRTFDVALNEAMDENKEQIEAFAAKRVKSVRMQLKAVGDMGLANISGLNTGNATAAPGIYGLPNRRLHMRDIVRTGRMTSSDFTYLKEVGGEGDVASWTENSGAKAQLDLDYIEERAPSQYIAGFLKISRKSLDDITALRSSLAARLLEKYLIKEDQQILSGTGAGGELDGILNDAVAYDGDKTRLVERVVDAIGQLEESEHYADGIILRPRDYSDLTLTASTTGEFTLPGVGTVTMQNGILFINGVPVYKMNGMPADIRQFLVGDWLMGAQLLIREDPVVEFFEQDGDNVQKNMITVRVEGRIALPKYYSDAFVKGAVEGAPAV